MLSAYKRQEHRVFTGKRSVACAWADLAGHTPLMACFALLSEGQQGAGDIWGKGWWTGSCSENGIIPDPKSALFSISYHLFGSNSCYIDARQTRLSTRSTHKHAMFTYRVQSECKSVKMLIPRCTDSFTCAARLFKSTSRCSTCAPAVSVSWSNRGRAMRIARPTDSVDVGRKSCLLDL